MPHLKIEAIFAGFLALVVFGVALYAVATTQFGDGGAKPAVKVAAKKSTSIVSVAASGEDGVCACYDKAFKMAGKANVLSGDYRTGFVECRTVLGVEGGAAWTAGWNARLSAKPYTASCKAYKRRAAA